MIYIVGNITMESYEIFAQELDKAAPTNGYIDVELTSDGGNSDAALAYYSKIRECEHRVRITTRGACQSAATLILAAGDERIAAPETIFMFHESERKLKGTAQEIRVALKEKDTDEEHWRLWLSCRLDTTDAELKRLHASTTFFYTEKALAIKLIHKVKRYEKL